MTVAEAHERVAKIRAEAGAGDSECAHAEEDKFREDVLRHVFNHDHECGCDELAAIALSTGDIAFSRWYA